MPVTATIVRGFASGVLAASALVVAFAGTASAEVALPQSVEVVDASDGSDEAFLPKLNEHRASIGLSEISADRLVTDNACLANLNRSSTLLAKTELEAKSGALPDAALVAERCGISPMYAARWVSIGTTASSAYTVLSDTFAARLVERENGITTSTLEPGPDDCLAISAHNLTASVSDGSITGTTTWGIESMIVDQFIAGWGSCAAMGVTPASPVADVADTSTATPTAAAPAPPASTADAETPVPLETTAEAAPVPTVDAPAGPAPTVNTSTATPTAAPAPPGYDKPVADTGSPSTGNPGLIVTGSNDEAVLRALAVVAAMTGLVGGLTLLSARRSASAGKSS